MYEPQGKTSPTFTHTSLFPTETYMSHWNTPKNLKEMDGMTEGDQLSHRLRDLGTVPMCISICFLITLRPRTHTPGGQQSSGEIFLLWPAHGGRSERSKCIRLSIKRREGTFI